MHPALALALGATLTLGAHLEPRQAADEPCKALHVFLARGNNEPYPGRQGKLAGAICSGLASCDYEDIQFYNPLEAPYCQSIEEGAANGIAQIRAYNERCPDAALVVSGYSQGAHVLGDVLGGGGGIFFEGCRQKTNEGLGADTPAGRKVVAAMLFGDTRHTAGQSYNYLSGGDRDGLFPRPGDQLAELDTFAGVLRSYCVDSDPICAGGDDVDNHLNYFDIYSEEAGEWVREMASKAADSVSSTSAAVESTSTTSSASSTTATSSDSGSSSAESTAESSASSESSMSSESSSTSSSETTGEAATATTTGSDAAQSSATEAAAASSTSADDDSGAPALVSGPWVALVAFVAQGLL